MDLKISHYFYPVQRRIKFKGLKVCILSLFLLISINHVYAFTAPSIKDIPKSIQVKDNTISLQSLTNPFETDSIKKDKFIEEGAAVYFKNCFLCHGDHLAGDGLFADRFYPAPANFRAADSILSKPVSYSFWRIMKGGKGLPEKYQPWNSAMPSWENQLTQSEVWKVILFLKEKLRENLSISSPKEPSVERGQYVYTKKCTYCHGAKAEGDGYAAPFSSPPPRKLTKSQFKLRSTPFGKVPTDQDMFHTLSYGLNATTMPGWRNLTEVDRWSLIAFLKSISRKFQRFIKKGKTHKIIQVPEPPAFSLESKESGKILFLMNCSGCHGYAGRSDGESTERIVDIGTGAIWPRNLSKPWTFRRGIRRKDLFLTIRSGLYGSAMPMFSTRTHTDQQIWDIVNYVQTLGPSEKPPVEQSFNVRKVGKKIPSNPNDSFWKTVETHFIPLGGQILEGKKLYTPIIDSATVKAVHNGDEIAFRLTWDDPQYDPILKDNVSVKESPPPPVPAGMLKLAEDDEEEDEEPQEIPDAIAIQFPTQTGSSIKPYFLNGDVNHSVNLWKWQSNYPLRVQEINANGINQIKVQSSASQNASGSIVFEYGQYRLVIKRKLSTTDIANDTQFASGQKSSIAFNAWDGSSKEQGEQMSISSWFDIILE